MFSTPGSRAGRKRPLTTGGGGLPLIGTGATVTTNSPLLDLSQTWNNAGVTFTGFKLNVTRTADAGASALFDFQYDSQSLLKFTNAGTGVATAGGSLVLTANFPHGQTMIFSPRDDSTGSASLRTAGPGLQLDGPIGPGSNTALAGGPRIFGSNTNNSIWISNGTAAITFRVYNTTDNDSAVNPTNYERGIFDWTTTANILTIGTQKGGTGSNREVRIVSAAGVIAQTVGSDFYVDANNFYMRSAAPFNQWAFGGNYAMVFNGGNPSAGFYRVADKVIGFADNSNPPASVSGWMQWAGQARVTANFTSSNATLTAITGISSVALQAGRNYAFKAWLAVTGSSLAGVQVGITCSSTTITTLLSDGYMHDAGVMRGSSVGVIASTGTPVVAVSSATVTSSNPAIRIDGMIRVASSGLFGLTLAQSTASATQTVVSSASFMIVYDMP